MIKITNGVDILNVSNGAYEGIFKNQGYKPFDASAKKVVAEKVEAPVKKEVVEDEVPGKSPEAEVDEDPEIAALLEKPISSWSKDELKVFTTAKDIDTSSAKSVPDVKAIVQEYINDNK